MTYLGRRTGTLMEVARTNNDFILQTFLKDGFMPIPLGDYLRYVVQPLDFLLVPVIAFSYAMVVVGYYPALYTLVVAAGTAYLGLRAGEDLL